MDSPPPRAHDSDPRAGAFDAPAGVPRGRAAQRLRSAAVLVPVLGLFLWMPPFVTVFVAPRTVAGIPLIVLFLFGVWMALVVVAALLSRRLSEPEAEPDPLTAALDPAPEAAAAAGGGEHPR